ncbi:MAG: hypothetical protein PHH54_04955 [Candidatus Nanoarchaeia archaeon]|nr:hypothetical protein [Candidatus Nanoarchaeia archaeon]MDD5741307.1 hypothetical protein [Candidatus Nanoarchaeia archaeon]
MKLKRIGMNKKGVSEMISYVILIAIAIGISIGVFIWLKDLANVNPKIDCRDGTSLRIDDVTCNSNIITIKLKNNGNFNVNGFIILASDDINRIPTTKLSAIYPDGAIPTTPGYYDFNTTFKPSDEPREISFTKEGFIEIIQIQPYIINEKGKIIVCEQALIKQDVSGCGILSYCGDNIINGTELCDGSDLNGNNCTTIPGGFTGGTLSCYPQEDPLECTFNTSLCTV